jgi:hypothetical protein
MRDDGRLTQGLPWEEMHAFNEPWFSHPNFTAQEAKNIQEEAYLRDFQELGPSWFRLIETEYRGWEYLRKSDKPHLRARADFFAQQMRVYKILLAAMDYLVPSAHMRELIKNVRRQVERSFGSVNPFQITAASGIFLSGRFREFRNRHWGDVIQPPTSYMRYNRVK